MLTKNGNGTPAYKRIQAVILKQIEDGELKPGNAVDSERSLAKAHNVSLMTARHALLGLEREGLVERRRGAGTFVSQPKIHFNKLMSYSEQMGSRNLLGFSKVLSFKVVDAPEIVARLSLPSSTPLLRIQRLRIASDEPFALETCYLSSKEFPDMTRSRLERGSLFSMLEQDYGLEIAYADEEIDATCSDHETAKLLGIAPDHALLRIRQTIFSSKGKAVVYVLGEYRADRHVLRIRRYR